MVSNLEDPVKEFCEAIDRGDYVESEGLLLSLPQTRSFAAAAKLFCGLTVSDLLGGK